MGELIIMCGMPGSGKSTWLKENVRNENAVVISRDEIRFKMVSEDENYFSKEKEVFKEFIKQITYNLKENKIVYADATHINEVGRNKLLSAIKIHIPLNFDISVVVLSTSVEKSIKRNSGREGRARVPEAAIINMANLYTDPKNDKFNYKQILYVYN